MHNDRDTALRVIQIDLGRPIVGICELLCRTLYPTLESSAIVEISRSRLSAFLRSSLTLLSFFVRPFGRLIHTIMIGSVGVAALAILLVLPRAFPAVTSRLGPRSLERDWLLNGIDRALSLSGRQLINIEGVGSLVC